MNSVPAQLRKITELFAGSGLRKQIVRGGIASLAVKGSSLILGFMLAVLLARLLGPDGFGVYAFVLAAVTVLAIPAQVGLPQLMVRETAKANASQDWPLMSGLWRWGNKYVATFSTAMVAIGVVLLCLGEEWMDAERRNTIPAALALIPLVALGNLRGASLRGLGKVVLGQFPEHILRPALLLIFISTLLLFTESTAATPALAMKLHVLAALVAFIIGTILLIKAKPTNLTNKLTPTYQKSYWRSAATPLALLAGLQIINGQADILMLGLMRSDTEVGIYRVVAQVATLVIFGLQAFNLVLQPHYARLYAQGDMQQLQKLVTYSARGILLISIPPALVMILAGGALLEFTFGVDYRRGEVALAIITIGQLVNAGAGSVGILLNMTGHERDTLRGISIAAIANATLNLILIPELGMVGAAIATTTSLVIWNIYLWVYAQKRLGINSSALRLRT